MICDACKRPAVGDLAGWVAFTIGAQWVGARADEFTIVKAHLCAECAPSCEPGSHRDLVYALQRRLRAPHDGELGEAARETLLGGARSH